MELPVKVLQRGDAFLKQPALRQALPFDRSLSALAEQLLKTMQAKQGIGIAATQIGRSESLCIVASQPNARYPNAPEMAPLVLVNPEILELNGEVLKGWEGCLSVAGYRGLVPRHERVTVQYHDLQGNAHCVEQCGFVARVFQHEIDHLNGVLFPERMEHGDHLVTEDEYQRLGLA